MALENYNYHRDQGAILRYLLEQDDLDPNLATQTEQVATHDAFNITPLMYAAQFHNVNTLKLLSSHKKIDLRKTDSRGWLPIHYACQDMYKGDNLEFLLSLDPQAINYQHSPGSDTPLMVVCKKPVGMYHLLRKEVDISLLDKHKNTALHILCSSSERQFGLNNLLHHPKITEIINAENNEGNSPLELLLKSIADYLINPTPTDYYDELDNLLSTYINPFDFKNIEILIKNNANPYKKITFNDKKYDIYSFIEMLEQQSHIETKKFTNKLCEIIKNAIKNNIPEVVKLILTNDTIINDEKNINGFNEKVTSPWIDYKEEIFKNYVLRIKSSDKIAINNLKDIKSSRIFHFLSYKKFGFFSTSYDVKLLSLKQSYFGLESEMKTYDLK